MSGLSEPKCVGGPGRVRIVLGLGLWLLAAAAGLLAAEPAAGSSQAAAALGVITVTTTADDFGADLAHCSLREAIQAISVTQDFGGCPAGTPGDTILLAADQTYSLSRAGSDDDGNATGDLDLWVTLAVRVAGGRAVIDATGLGDRVLDAHAGALTLEDLKISGGDVTAAGVIVKNGGGLRNTTVVSLTRVDITDNRAQFGGGIFNAAGMSVTLTLQEGVIARNVALVQAGGVFNEAQFLLVSSSLISNTADQVAGGLYNENVAGGALRNVTVSGNVVSSGDGGGIYNVDIARGLVLNNVTLSGNSAFNSGGGVYNDGKLILSNTLLAANGAGFDPDCSGAGVLESQGYLLLGTGAAACGLNLTGVTATVISTTAPLLAPLALNGGRTPTHALQAGSPAIDQGNPAAPASGYTCEPTDQRGIRRIPRCDIGAYDSSRALYLPVVTKN